MTHIPRILIQHINYMLPSHKTLFSDLSLTFSHRKTGLVGKNGIGKSSLIKLITGEHCPNSGSIHINGTLAYVPQESEIEQRSGGEVTQLLLAKAFSSQANILLLDEPTNHLDHAAREQLYKNIHRWRGAMIIISHDRTLLNLMDEIVELNTLGAFTYGGNYDAYVKQRELEKNAADNMLKARREILSEAKELVQIRREHHKRAQAKGRHAKKAEIKAKGCYDKLSFKSAKGRSEQTNRRIRTQAERKVGLIETQLQEAKNKIEIMEEMNLSLPRTHVPNGKIILEVENLTFSYPGSDEPIIKNFDLKIMGPERIALVGNNGSGKTTLIKLILNLLKNTANIYLGTDHIAYLDQNANILDREKTLIDNFLKFNSQANENEAHAALAKFLFKNEAAKKRVEYLSGGEKLRATLACILMSPEPPRLLILDEPTNHLDLDSIKSIESVLKAYRGAMIVISHDDVFLNNIGVEKYVEAPFIIGTL